MKLENSNLRIALDWLDDCPHHCIVSSYTNTTLHIKVNIPIHYRDEGEQNDVCRDSE